MRRFVCALSLAVACDTPAPPSSEPPKVPAAESVASASPPVPAPVEAKVKPLEKGGARAASSPRGMVSSEEENATRAGVDILAAGGNAIDAAVAVGYALSVTHHSAGSLGGGGFMIVRLASGESFAIDYRERAPAAATVAANEKQLAKGAHGYASAPVPGVVAGLNLARDRFGSMPLKELMAPAVRLARDGHVYSKRQALVLSWFWERMHDPTLRAILGRKRALAAGERVKQPSLAKTLEAIAGQGNDGFYRGDVAENIAKAHKRHGGFVTVDDLAGYRAELREPLAVDYRGYRVLTMPPPSMGGIALASILLARLGVPGTPPPAESAESLHLFVEASRRAYADRRAIGADPAAIDRKLFALLLDARYYTARKPAIDPSKATPSSAVIPIQEAPAPVESSDTTHFSVVDAQGNAVSCTTTLSAAFGAWVAVPETGVILSNAMGGFSPSGVNALAPNKRMASSMTPTIIVSGKHVAAVLGSPGGDTIPSTVSQVVLNLIDHRMTIDRAIDVGRVHHQYKPDELRTEKDRAPAADVIARLKAFGHTVKPNAVALGNVNGIVFDPPTHTAWGFADQRKGGLALGPSTPKTSP